MGRERQKRKNRSGLSRVRQRTKSKKTVLNNPIIAANWDKSQTLVQNYKRLGLATKLNKQTGGVEKKVADIDDEYAHGGATRTKDLTITNSSGLDTITLSEVKVERDPKTGRILRVIQDDSAISRPNPLNDPLNDLDSDDDSDNDMQMADQHLSSIPTKTTQAPSSNTVINQLEERANLPAAKYKRKQTDNEKAFIESLVRKYGEDYGKMARDIKLNYMQRSEGDLKNRIKIWKDNGGIAD